MTRTAAVSAVHPSTAFDRPKPPTSVTSNFVARSTPADGAAVLPIFRGTNVEKRENADFEILESSELALRLKVKESWVVEQSKRSRTADPIPVFRLGKHRRYRWGSPEMNDWLARRAGGTTTRKVWS